MRAFQPFSAHSARTMISMSEPNCRLLVSPCIFFSAVSTILSPPTRPLAAVEAATAASGPGPERDSGDRPSDRLARGDSGVSGSCGSGANPVMQSMTRHLAALLDADAGVLAKLDFWDGGE